MEESFPLRTFPNLNFYIFIDFNKKRKITPKYKIDITKNKKMDKSNLNNLKWRFSITNKKVKSEINLKKFFDLL